MAATGFASDAEHLINVAAGRVLSRISIYDAPMSSSLTSGKSVDPHRLVREDVSSMMIDSAMSDGGRPWGVQLLVIGQSALSRNRLLDMYTIDPSGGWRHRHGTIAAIGRGAERISVSSSSMLEEDLTNYRIKSSGWRRALDVAMNAAINTFEKSEDNSIVDVLNNPTEKYSAVVIFGNCSGKRLFVQMTLKSATNLTVKKDCLSR
jgi:20S proteasome alpha/beta subunit